MGLRPLAAQSSDAAATVPTSRLFAIGSSPYASRRDSAYVDASLIEVGMTKGFYRFGGKERAREQCAKE